MSSATLAVNFAFADGTNKILSVGPYDVTSSAVQNFKTRVQNFNAVDTTSQKKFTNLVGKFKSDNGAEITGIKSASITVSQSTRIFDAATYQP